MFSRPGRMYSIGRPSLSNPLRILGVLLSTDTQDAHQTPYIFPVSLSIRTYATGIQYSVLESRRDDFTGVPLPEGSGRV